MKIFGGFSCFWVFVILFCCGRLLAQNEPKPPFPINSPSSSSSSSSSNHPTRPPLSLRYFIIPQTQPPPHPHSPPPSSLAYRPNVTPFRPSIAVIVAVLTTMFSITFLLLLYAKHCRGNGTGRRSSPSSTGAVAGYTNRRNSGIDRSVIESLPIFRFASLRGQKDGLECSVCLNRFEPNEVLRLLPKCKHAFHVECVDTWLDAHSTCPLCRDRVEPEDVLLVHDFKPDKQEAMERNSITSTSSIASAATATKSDEFTRRISGRHSSAGERKSNFLQILIQRPGESTQTNSNPLIRKSVDSVMISRKANGESDETTTVGCFDRGGGVRKDGLLLSADRENFLRRYDHKIVLSGGAHNRWSDLRPSDLLYLQSEMLISNTGRYSLSSSKKLEEANNGRGGGGGGRSVISTRSVSEITGLSRFAVGPGKV